jgi:hypothetical protein
LHVGQIPHTSELSPEIYHKARVSPLSDCYNVESITNRRLFLRFLRKCSFNPYMKIGAARAKVVQRGIEEELRRS